MGANAVTLPPDVLAAALDVTRPAPPPNQRFAGQLPVQVDAQTVIQAGAPAGGPEVRADAQTVIQAAGPTVRFDAQTVLQPGMRPPGQRVPSAPSTASGASGPSGSSGAPAEPTTPSGIGSVLPRIGRFIVLEPLGAGAMGVVYAAYDASLDRKIAIKVLRQGSASDGAASDEHMLREAQAMARVSHPNIITVHEVGAVEGEVFLAMEFIRGRTLAAWIAPGPHPWRETVGVLLQAGRGLAAAHAAGLVHGDFKPANVMLGDDGIAKVLDFGLARVHDDHPTLVDQSTAAGPTLGTPAYMAPELQYGHPATPLSDQFSFCVSLYEALYGRDPFPTEAALLAGEVAEPPARPRVPGALLRVIRRGLSVDPARRFPSLPALLTALERTLLRRRRLGLVPVGVAAVFAGAMLWFGSLAPAADACDAAPRELVGLWDAAAAEQVHARLLESRLGYAEDTWARVHPRLDAYAQAIVERRTRACEAHRDGRTSPTLFDLRTACLDQRHASLAAFVRILQVGDAEVVRNATAAAATLPSVAACDDTRALTDVVAPHDDPALTARVEHVREVLAEAHAQELTGQFARGLAIVDAIELDAVQHPPLLAEVGLRRGSLLSELGQHAAADAALKDALRLALTGRHHLVAAAIATRRDFIRAARLQQPAEVLADGPIVEGLVTRVALYSEGAAYQGDHLNNLGIAEAVLGHPAEAQRQFEEALRLRREALGADHPQVVYAMGNLGLSYIESGDLERAVRLLRTALLAAESSLGPRHPHVALLTINLGYALRTLLKFREATTMLGHALELQTEQLGADSPDLHYVLHILGDLALDQRRCDEATKHYRRALALLEPGGQAAPIATTLAGLGRAATCAGDVVGALVHLQRAQALVETQLTADDPIVARLLAQVGDAQLAGGNLDEARASHERARALRAARLPASASELATSYRQLAEVARRKRELSAATAATARALQVLVDAGLGEGLASADVRKLSGELALERGDAAQALRDFERAATLLAASADPDNADLALARFGMARALAASARARTPEARTLAEQALAALQAQDTAYPAELAALRAWLAG